MVFRTTVDTQIAGCVLQKETGAGISGIKVRAISDAISVSPRQYAWTGADGSFTLTGLREGSVSLTPDDLPGDLRVVEPGVTRFDIVAGEPPPTPEIIVQPASEFACIVTNPDGAPVPGATVHFYLRPPIQEHWSPTEASTGDDGRVSVGHLPQDHGLCIIATHEGLCSSSQEIPADQVSGAQVELVLTGPTGTIAGIVYPPGDLPMTKAFVSVKDGETGFSDYARVEPSGAFSIPNLPAGSYRLTYYGHNALPEYLQFKTVPVTVALEPGEDRSGIVLEGV